MILVVDIGNTNITLGVYEKDLLECTFRLVSDVNKTIEEYSNELKGILKDFDISGCIIGSVVNELDDKLKRACDMSFGINSLVLHSKLKLNVILDTEHPECIGVDRIANVCAAYKLYKSPIIVVDLGSATTFDIVSSDGRFWGGIIMPGIKMQLRALHDYTSKLPEVEIKDVNAAIGIDTETCILSGVVRGAASAIEGLIKQCENELNSKATVILTGGYCSFIAKYLEGSYDYINTTLTLDGLKYIFEVNKNLVNI